MSADRECRSIDPRATGLRAQPGTSILPVVKRRAATLHTSSAVRPSHCRNTSAPPCLRGSVVLALLLAAGALAGQRGASGYLDRSDEWFKSPEARKVADNILTWQSDLGDWPKNEDTTAKPYAGRRSALKGTFDNGATTGELRFLACIFNATADRKYRDALLKGLDHIIAAQYPTGGWPQFYPPGRQYHRHITFNDDVMVRLMRFLRETYSSGSYAFIDEQRKNSARAAFDTGIECILKCQIKVKGKLTAWCAQHDEKDLSPAGGRTYELPSISGAESVGIVRLLMSIDDPPPQVVQAVESAVAWFASAKITGIRIDKVDDPAAPKGKDKRVVADAQAPPIWARFYEIGTNRPMFVDRDGVVKYRMSDIGYERRNGYAWYGDWPRELLAKEYPAWQQKMGAKDTTAAPAGRPAAIVFPKIDRRPAADASEPFYAPRRKPMTSEAFPRLDPRSARPAEIDLRRWNLSQLDLRDRLDELMAAMHDSRTIWPAAGTLPRQFDPKAILESGRNSGLGVRKLHERGITGRGIGIAIIDQPLLVEHEEYADRLRLYEEINIAPGSLAQMHGPAVASIAVGRTVGVAPQADLYFIACMPGQYSGGKFTYDFHPMAQGVRRILEINSGLPEGRKIRVISLSIGWSANQAGFAEMNAACEQAKTQGMLIVCSCIENVHGVRFHGLGRNPLRDPEAFESYEPGLWWAGDFPDPRWTTGRLMVPMDSRTTASPSGKDEYVFYRQGGWSWAIPYIAGVYALAAQVDAAITPQRFWDAAMKTGRKVRANRDGKTYELGPIINPPVLIDALQRH